MKFSIIIHISCTMYNFEQIRRFPETSVEFYLRKIADDFDFLIFIKISSPSHILSNEYPPYLFP